MTKRCSRCDAVKPLTEFYGNRTAYDGKQTFCKECAKASARAWYYANPRKSPEKNREAQRKFRERHPGRDAEYGRKWREKNGERALELARARGRKWRQTKPEGRVASQLRRRAKLQEVTADDQDYIAILRSDPCSYCGGPAKPVDHIEPIWHGGAAGWENLTASCQSCNSSKRTDSLLSFLLRKPTRQGASTASERPGDSAYSVRAA